MEKFLNSYPIESCAKFIGILGYIFHGLLCNLGFVLFIYFTSYKIKNNILEQISLCVGIALLFSVNIFHITIYHVLIKSTKTRNYLMVLPALVILGFLTSIAALFSALSFMSIIVIPEMFFAFAVSLMISAPMIYLFWCLSSLYFKLYNESLGRQRNVPANYAPNAPPKDFPYQMTTQAFSMM